MATVEEIVFLGTGTSGAVPNVACLTDPEKSCHVCLSSMTPEGRKNMKKNTSLVVRYRKHSDPPGARLRNVLIDCGKTFYDSAIELFPRYGIRELDGVILTHGHADACFGLDNLRQWTLGGQIQDVVDVYLSTETMDTLARTFPFLVDIKYATGGGDVAAFRYHVIDNHAPFTIEGLEFLPLPGEPYWCLGFKMDGISYISDTNYIPPETMSLIQGTSRVFVVDCLREGKTHASHFALGDSLNAARVVKPTKTYLVGTTHRVDHYTFTDKLAKLATEENLRVAPAFDGLRVLLTEVPGAIVERSYLDSEPTVVKDLVA